MQKNLPVQLINMRGDVDTFWKEGMGSEISWVTPGLIERNCCSMTDSFGTFRRVVASGEKSYPLLVTARLDERATAKSYRPNVRSVFDNKESRNVIGMDGYDKVILKIDDQRSLDELETTVMLVKDGKGSRKQKNGIAIISELSLFTPHIEDSLVGHTVKVRLVNYLDNRLNKVSADKFERACLNLDIQAEQMSYSPELRLYEIPEINQQQLDMLATMDSVISIKRMPYVELSVSPEPYNTELEVKEPSNNEEYPVVGLLDSGVAEIPHLKPWIIGENQNIAGLDSDDIDYSHGTAVAGIMTYGDELLRENVTGCSPVKILSGIVNTSMDKARISEKECIMHIRTAIEQNPDVKIWNLSQGSDRMITDDCFSEYAMALDYLQKRYGVLICKSAGNISVELPGNRLTNGADSVRSLVVGSIAFEANPNFKDEAKVGQRSPFSRIGPGPEFLTKPDLVHYGGNAHTGIDSFSVYGYQGAEYKGTSFSTPRVTALAANLAFRLNRPFDPILIKALLIHSANYPSLDGMERCNILKELGHGLPPDVNSILNNDPDEFTMILQPEFTREKDFQIQDIPFPSFMVGEDGCYSGDIVVTVVTDPVLKESEGREYCQTDVEVLLQTYDGIEHVDVGAPGVHTWYRNSERLINPQNVLSRSLYGQKHLKATDMHERTLIENSQKYQPVKKYQVSLDHMTPKPRREYLNAGKKWCLSIKSRYRDSTLADMELDGEEKLVRAVIIITIKDGNKNGCLYDECIRMLEQYHFVHTDIVASQHIELGLE